MHIYIHIPSCGELMAHLGGAIMEQGVDKQQYITNILTTKPLVIWWEGTVYHQIETIISQ